MSSKFNFGEIAFPQQHSIYVIISNGTNFLAHIAYNLTVQAVLQLDDVFLSRYARHFRCNIRNKTMLDKKTSKCEAFRLMFM